MKKPTPTTTPSAQALERIALVLERLLKVQLLDRGLTPELLDDTPYTAPEDAYAGVELDTTAEADRAAEEIEIQRRERAGLPALPPEDEEPPLPPLRRGR